MRLLDTDILIDILRNHPPAVRWLSIQTEIPLVTGFSAMELQAGCADKKQVRAVDDLIRRFALVWPTENDLQRALDHFTDRRLRYNLGILDSFIGECAVGRGIILCTFNVKHFQAIAGLKIEQPYVR